VEFESDQRVKIVRILAFEVEGWRWLEGLRPYQRSTRNERRSDLVFPGVFCITSGVWTSSFNRYHSISFTSPSIKSFGTLSSIFEISCRNLCRMPNFSVSLYLWKGRSRQTRLWSSQQENFDHHQSYVTIRNILLWHVAGFLTPVHVWCIFF
jgi:hypothetical protein